MWLINTETFGLEEFANYPKHGYAILSHRWEENEVSFEDWKGRKYVQRKGYLKIMRFVQKAAEQGFKYAWADTCCINKDSSAELSEAINSMFKYYQDAATCYVYLSDLPPLCPSDKLDVTTPPVIVDDDSRNTIFANSKWFTRGWTLQEMIAPRTLQFFDSAWHPFGTKHGLAAVIESRTGVPKEILDGFQQLNGTSIACRMSWAADRQTTRAEDLAYCLLGIFDIHLPLLYGEGEAAFIRLQEEICRKTTDMSLFAWTTLLPDHQYSGLLARSPSNFRKSANVTCWSSALQPDFNDEIAVTHRGIRFDNMALYISSQYGVLLELNCWNYSEDGQLGNVFICLSQAPGSWVRCRANEIVCVADGILPSLKSFHLSRIFVRTTMEPGAIRSSNLFNHAILFECSPGITLISAEPSQSWDLCMQGFLPIRGLCGALHISAAMQGGTPEEFIILCNISTSYYPNWIRGYQITVLGQKSVHFNDAKELVRRKQICTREGYLELRRLHSIFTRDGLSGHGNSGYVDAASIGVGIHYEISITPRVVREEGADADSWDVMKVQIHGPRIANSKL